MKHFYQILFIFFCFYGKAQVTEVTKDIIVNPAKITINSRIKPPNGFYWEKEEANSFGEFLGNFALKPEGFPVRDFTEMPINRQYNHVAILDIDIGRRDLQQCADAWIRLYAEFLWAEKRTDEIEFDFTSGQKMSWNDFKNGFRTTEIGEKVKFHKSAKPDSSYKNFRKYLDLIFQYAGTISLDRESDSVLKSSDIKTGDLIITPGSPGHSVFVVGIAKNRIGKKIYLLAESFMPAQDIHIIVNPMNRKISPWFELDVNAPQLLTPRYLFKPVTIKRFRSLK